MQTPKFSRTYTTLRWSCIFLFAINVVLALIVLVPLFVERVDQWSGWQSGEWAAAGAWLGGTMTFFAVSVAVWQTNNANRQARAAEHRAQAEMVNTERKHSADIEAQRRTEQIQIVANIWTAVGEVHRHVHNVDEAFYDILKGRGTTEGRDRAYEPYSAALTHMDTTFTISYMLVHDSEIEALIRASESAHKLLVKAMQKAYRENDKMVWHDQDDLLARMAAVNEFREPMTTAARDYRRSTTARVLGAPDAPPATAIATPKPEAPTSVAAVATSA
ncbi:hypothetical protein ACQR36_29850 [Rhodococcus erythropolis]|uniref:hypothetical protein n=1 Tax=Rhodococcus erythropolis TaxID=1833 RepID=UPI003D14334D